MGNLIPLTDAQLAAIAEATRKNQYASGISIDQAFRVEALLSHIAWQATRLAEAERTIVQRVATIHGLMKIIDGHEAEVEDLAQRCDKATAQLATAQATIERQREALEQYADDRNWAQVTMYEEGDDMGDPQGDTHYYWERDWDGLPWLIAEVALAPPAPEADDAR